MSSLDIVKVKTGSPFEAKASYSRAVCVGDLILVSNTAGLDYVTRVMAPDAASQARQCLATISAAMEAVGSSLRDVVQVRVFVPDPQDWDAVIVVLGEAFRGIDPASTFTASPLAGAYKVEIEATGWRGAGAASVREISLVL